MPFVVRASSIGDRYADSAVASAERVQFRWKISTSWNLAIDVHEDMRPPELVYEPVVYSAGKAGAIDASIADKNEGHAYRRHSVTPCGTVKSKWSVKSASPVDARIR